VADGDVARPVITPGADSGQRHDLLLRIASALLLAPLAVLAAYLGSWPFALFWGAAAIGVLFEWSSIVPCENRGRVRVAGAIVLAAAAALAVIGNFPAGFLAIGLGAIVTGGLASSPQRGWSALGTAYAGIVLIAPVVLRSDSDYGFVALIFLFGIVWATDSFGYVVGRLVGGPKLWPRISPKKTWSGAIGGAVGGLVAALAIAHFAGLGNLLALGRVALLLSMFSQAGDLLESAFKRRFGVKDASHIIPGHGGIMDRVDGFLAAVFIAAILGIARGGIEAPARGLLVW
jgi:phosphatidate cytidylyltransferase